MMGQCRGVAGGSLKWLPSSRLELPLMAFCRMEFYGQLDSLRNSCPFCADAPSQPLGALTGPTPPTVSPFLREVLSRNREMPPPTPS